MAQSIDTRNDNNQDDECRFERTNTPVFANIMGDLRPSPAGHTPDAEEEKKADNAAIK